MKLASALLTICGTGIAVAQTDFPSNPMVGPKKYEKRSVGGEIDSGAKVEEKQPSTRYTTHIILYDNRIWTSTEGQALQGKLIAFEDLVVEAPKGGAEPKMPEPPARPTVVRDGKVRLLVNQKPVEIPLSRLGVADTEFISQMEAALDKKAAAGR